MPDSPGTLGRRGALATIGLELPERRGNVVSGVVSGGRMVAGCWNGDDDEVAGEVT